MKTIRFSFMSICMLLLWAMPSVAQSSRLDSLQHVQQKIDQQSQQLQLQYDSLYKIIAQCKTDAERLVQYEVLNKLEKKSQQLGNHMRKVEDACGLGFGETVYLIFFHSCDCCFQ